MRYAGSWLDMNVLLSEGEKVKFSYHCACMIRTKCQKRALLSQCYRSFLWGLSLCYTSTAQTHVDTCTHTLRKWKINVVNNASFDWSVETGVKKKRVISVCRLKCVDGLSHFQVCFSQSQSDSSVWNAAQYLMKPCTLDLGKHLLYWAAQSVWDSLLPL